MPQCAVSKACSAITFSSPMAARHRLQNALRPQPGRHSVERYELISERRRARLQALGQRALVRELE